MSQINTVVPRSYARLGANHGYVIEGDVAQLHADVELSENPPHVGNWALQLWACDTPHVSGPLAGVKVAEAALNGSSDRSEHAWRLDAEAEARVPGGQRDYAMVLVLASGDAGHFTQVHDFANYPARQRFATPHFDGSVGYQIDGTDVVLEADALRNPRDADNISGSLCLELWALSEPYLGGTAGGHCLARSDLGRLHGQSSLHAVSERVEFSTPPAGSWEVVLMLREWAGAAGYVTRDFARFVVRYEVPETTPAAVAIAAKPTPAAAAIVAAPALEAEATPRSTQVNINRATLEELAAIKGLTRKVAAEIMKQRPFTSIDALLDVKGIGPKLLGKVRVHLTS